MVHCQTIANTDSIELDWHTTCVADTVFYGLYNIFQAYVTRDNLIERIGNTDDWSTISSSTKPRAFSKDLCGARATPVFKLSLLQLMLISSLLKASTWTAFTTHKKRRFQ